MDIYQLRNQLLNIELNIDPSLFSHDIQYLKLMIKILMEGNIKTDRTGTGTISLFGPQMEFDLKNGFPLLTTKKMNFQNIFWETVWFLNGGTNTQFLKEHNVKIWDNWADSNGNLGPIYGSQWINWNNEGIDQIQILIQNLINNPDSRRHIISAWNVSQLDIMALPPCHTLFQFYVNNNKLSCKLYQRSGDFFIGTPYNIINYSLITHIIAKICNFEVDNFIITYGDVHIYTNHLEQCLIQLQRNPYSSPEINITNKSDWFPNFKNIQFDDVILNNYNHHPIIKAPISI